MNKVIDRRTNKIKEDKTSKALFFLYNTVIGRCFLKLVTKPFITKINGRLISSRISKVKIKSFIKNNNIDMSDYPKEEYASFNDFFIRKIKPSRRPISKNKKELFAIADSKIFYFKIDKNTNLKIKNSIYTVSDLIQDEEIAKKYLDGICLVLRLSADDYHHYSYLDNGKLLERKTIKGIFHTVNPIAFSRYEVFIKNHREYNLLVTENFGDVIQIEVGALNIGKIMNNNKKEFQRGDEKGYFAFGGSTIVLLFEKDKVVIDEDIILNSKKGIETKVILGEKIGRCK